MGWQGGKGVWLDGECVDLERCGLLVLKQAFFFFFAIASFMAIQRVRQAGLHGLHRPVLIGYEINYSRHVLKTF